jgi:hypothetical protein
MDPSSAEPAHQPSRAPWHTALAWLRAWPALWLTALLSLLAQLALCQFFSFGQRVPVTIDVNPSNVWKYAYHFPPRGEFLTRNWFGIANLPPTLNPFSFAAAHLPPWLFFTSYTPLIATAALLAMTAFLRELDLPRPAALFGGVVYAWQGDLLPFVFPGHFGYITTWVFFALAAWAALRAPRHWAYALIAGASCGMMVGLQPDRGAIASLLIAAFYLAPVLLKREPAAAQFRSLALCIAVAALVSFAGFLALFQSNIIGVKLGGATNREQAFVFATQFSLGPRETLGYLVPGFFGWHSSSLSGPYWGWIGQTPDWEATHQGTRNFNLAISTTGTVASILALLGAGLLLPGIVGRFLGRDGFSQRQLDFGRLLLILGAVSLVLSWGYHTPLYRVLFTLPLMDKWRDPLKWLETFNFAAVTLAAFGAAQIFRSIADATQRRALGLFLAVIDGVLFVLFLASYPLAIIIAGYLNGDGYQPADIASVMHTLHLSLGFAFVLGALLWLCLVGAWYGDRLQPWDIPNPLVRRLWHWSLEPVHRPATLGLCCAVLVALQMSWVDSQFIEPLDLFRLTATNPLIDSLRSEGPLVRVAVPQPQDALLNTFLQNQFALYRISSIDISAASRIPDSLTAFVNAFSGHAAKLWLIGGVKNVAIAEQDITTLRQEPEVASNIASADGYTLGPTPNDQPTHALVRMRDYFAKATFVPGAELPGKDDAVLKRLADPKWNPHATVLLPSGKPGAPFPQNVVAPYSRPIPIPPSVPVNVGRYTPHEIDLTVDPPTAGYVLINDQYDPDWQVELNGKPAPLLQADYLLRAVAVPPGPSTITLRYVAHYRLGNLSLPVILTNDFSDAIMLLSFIGGAFLIRCDLKTPRNVR